MMYQRSLFGLHRLAIAGRFGIGAPAAVIMLEELIAFGAASFVSIGTAGSLVRGLSPGSAAGGGICFGCTFNGSRIAD